MDVLTPRKLQPGDHVRLVSPASTPRREAVEQCVANLSRLGLVPEVAPHVFDSHGYLAGRDEDRLADFNDALRDPSVRAVVATRGGKGAYRIAGDLDFAAVRQDPKLIIGFSEITILHLALFKECGLVGLHGAAWDGEQFGRASAASFTQAVFTTDPVTVRVDPGEPTAALTSSGSATGPLLGGNQDLLATAAGWATPSFYGAILLLEAFNLRLGHIDRQLTMLMRSGVLDGIVGVAVGQYTLCGSDEDTQGDWTEIDVLRDRLGELGVPILGGLPIGHGPNALAVPVGTMARLDADNGSLVVGAAVG